MQVPTLFVLTWTQASMNVTTKQKYYQEDTQKLLNPVDVFTIATASICSNLAWMNIDF